MKLTVLSGKGGVGKSMIASSLSLLLTQKNNVIALDCDVDAPNLALWLGIDTSKIENALETELISTVQKPQIDPDKCQRCGKCVISCNFNALKSPSIPYAKNNNVNSMNSDLNLEGQKPPEIISYRCEGCGLCEIVCPYDAIQMQDVYNCTLSTYKIRENIFAVQGQIKPGEAESGEVVTEIRRYSQRFAKDKFNVSNKKAAETFFVLDGAAGIGCPVIASIVGSDYVVLVTEPSKSSISDMNRALEIVKNFEIPYGVIINKADLNKSLTSEIKKNTGEKYLGSINYNEKIIKSIVNLKPVIDTCPKTGKELHAIYENLKPRLANL